MMLDLLAAAAIAALPKGDVAPQTESNAFDLGATSPSPHSKDIGRKDDPVMAGDPLPPRGIDLRSIAIDAPELQLAVADKGPLFVLGALGGRQTGMPRLAHVAMVWKI